MAKKPSLRLRTHMSYEELETFIEGHCRQPFEIMFEGLDDAQKPRKVMTLVFQTDQERDSVRAALDARRGS